MASAQHESKVEGASDYDKVLHQQKHIDSVPMEKKDADEGDDDLMSESYGAGYATRSFVVSTTESSVAIPLTTSTSFITGGGFMKCMPIT